MPSTRSSSTKDSPTLAARTSALAPRSAARRAQSVQPSAASPTVRSTRTTRASSLYPSEPKASSVRDTPTSTGPPSEIDESLDPVVDQLEQEDEAEVIDKVANIKQEAQEEEWEMLHSSGTERSGLRGRNVEDTSHLEEEGLLRRVDSDLSEKSGKRDRPRSKEKETRVERVERVLDYGAGEGDQGLNTPRDRNAFALLILLCKSLDSYPVRLLMPDL